MTNTDLTTHPVADPRPHLQPFRLAFSPLPVVANPMVRLIATRTPITAAQMT